MRQLHTTPYYSESLGRQGYFYGGWIDLWIPVERYWESVGIFHSCKQVAYIMKPIGRALKVKKERMKVIRSRYVHPPFMLWWCNALSQATSLSPCGMGHNCGQQLAQDQGWAQKRTGAGGRKRESSCRGIERKGMNCSCEEQSLNLHDQSEWVH